MARCDTSCRTSCRRCGDFGSRAERKPDLLNIEVTTGIFRKAFQNFIKRRRALGIEYDRDDIAAADQKLVDWLVETYGGRNPHYEASDEWHVTVPDRVREAALREAKDAAVREAMGRLSPGAVHALRAAAKLRNSTPEEVLREELRDYVASQIPYVDVEGIIRNMAGVFYTAGYAVGTLKGWISRDEDS